MTTQHRGDDFIAAFNEIERHFRDSLGVDEHVSFGDMSRRYAEKHRLPTAQRTALRTFASLRNALSHHAYFAGKPIAEPVPEVVAEINGLRDLILRPPNAHGVLGRREVVTFSPGEPISAALDSVRELDYSQFPIYEDSDFVGLLTTNGIARWLAHRLSTVTLAEVEPIRSVLQFAEAQDYARHVPRSTTAAMAIDYLGRSNADGVPPAALIATHSGKASEKPLSVIVAADIATLSAALIPNGASRRPK